MNLFKQGIEGEREKNQVRMEALKNENEYSKKKQFWGRSITQFWRVREKNVSIDVTQNIPTGISKLSIDEEKSS